MVKFGLNRDGVGNPVGLWFNPVMVVRDEHVYVYLTLDELSELARILNNADIEHVTGGVTGE